jgi:hypothetical protein
MYQRFRRAGLTVAALVLLAGCASDGVEVSSAFDPLTTFLPQATFVWNESQNKLPADSRIEALDLGPILKSVSEQELAARGYRPVAPGGSPDYQISYELVVHTWIGGGNSRSVGSLSLLLAEADSGRKVWLGFSRTEIGVNITAEERKQRLRAILAKMLAEFPPGEGNS